MYIVFARKYRPQTLDEVIGQDVAVKTIKNAIEKNRLYHSILFYGSMGTGKTSLARIIAKSLNCVNGPTTNPCNMCENCKAIANSQSVDVIEIDGASNRRIDDARNIIESVQYVPLNARYKIYIIDEVHMLTEEAFNALLKTIEEPPDYVKFIFATTNIEKVPDTILSRCQIFKLNKISVENIFKKLKRILELEKVTASDEAIQLIAQVSQGSFRVAENYLDRVVAYQEKNIGVKIVSEVLGIADFEVIDRFIESIVNFNQSKAFEILNYLVEYNLKIETFVKMLLDKLLYVDCPLELKTAFIKIFYDAYTHIKYKMEETVAIEVATQKALSLKNLLSVENILNNLDSISFNGVTNQSNKEMPQDLTTIAQVSETDTDDEDIDNKERFVIELFGGKIIEKG